ncbi:MAG: exonuclease domain-containing protein [Candidatus Sericytochromatia bacterium]|nr:exonuclease domain-containing protein [Candidatus Sericytochromatia bacterium]
MPSEWEGLIQAAGRGERFHVVDTETTGSAPPSARVIEVACLTLQHGRVVGRFESLIDPGRPIPEFITRLTGITSAMVRGQPRAQATMEAFRAHLAAAPGHFVAHNAGFDARFLQFEFEQAGLSWPFNGRYCTVQLSRRCNPHLRRHNLDSLVAYYEVPMQARHRAMADVEATAIAFWHMVRELAQTEGLRLPPLQGLPVSPASAAPCAETAVPEPSCDVSPDQRLLQVIERESRSLAAMLAQQGRIDVPQSDGTLPIALRAPLLARLGDRRAALLAQAVREVYGSTVRVQLTPMP